MSPSSPSLAARSTGSGTRAAARTRSAGPRCTSRTLTRLRRIEGQVRGLHRMVAEERACPDVLTQIASVHEALRAVAREVLRSHLRQCATANARGGGPSADALYDELVDLMYRHVR